MNKKTFDITYIDDMVAIKTDDFYYSDIVVENIKKGEGCQTNSEQQKKELKNKYEKIAQLIREISNHKLSDTKKLKHFQ